MSRPRPKTNWPNPPLPPPCAAVLAPKRQEPKPSRGPTQPDPRDTGLEAQVYRMLGAAGAKVMWRDGRVRWDRGARGYPVLVTPCWLINNSVGEVCGHYHDCLVEQDGRMAVNTDALVAKILRRPHRIEPGLLTYYAAVVVHLGPGGPGVGALPVFATRAEARAAYPDGVRIYKFQVPAANTRGAP